MKNNFSKNKVIATMAIVGTLLVVSTIINSSSNMSVNAQLKNSHSIFFDNSALDFLLLFFAAKLFIYYKLTKLQYIKRL